MRSRSYGIVFAILFTLAVNSAVSAQIADPNRKNNPYSPSPSGRRTAKPATETVAQRRPTPAAEAQTTTAQKILSIRTKAESGSLPPSETYNVGVGDVLFVNLKNSPQGSRECTVRSDGSIDFPLAGEDIVVVGQTRKTIESMLAAGVTLFRDPHIEVSVRRYASHKVTVSGLAENTGEISLRREAIPLFVIRSETSVRTTATKVTVKRAPLLKLETYNLHDPATDDVLIFPGNSVNFE